MFILRRKAVEKYIRVSFFILAFLLASSGIILLLYVYGVIGSLNKVQFDFHKNRFELARAYTFAKKLSKISLGKRLLIITGWDDENRELVKAQIKKIKEALAGKVKILGIERVKVKKLKRDERRLTTISPVDFNKITSKYQRCDMIISMVGLPWNYEKLKIWRRRNRPCVALLDGRVRHLKLPLMDGRVKLLTVYRPDWTLLPNLPDDPEKLFSMRYLLITRENMPEMQRRHRFWRNKKKRRSNRASH